MGHHRPPPHVATTQRGEIRGYARLPSPPGIEITSPLQAMLRAACRSVKFFRLKIKGAAVGRRGPIGPIGRIGKAAPAAKRCLSSATTMLPRAARSATYWPYWPHWPYLTALLSSATEARATIGKDDAKRRDNFHPRQLHHNPSDRSDWSDWSDRSDGFTSFPSAAYAAQPPAAPRKPPFHPHITHAPRPGVL